MGLVDMNKLYVRFKCLQRDEISVFGLCVLVVRFGVIHVDVFFFFYFIILSDSSLAY